MRSKSCAPNVLKIYAYDFISPTANASRTLANFAGLAKKATANLAPGTVEAGASGTTSSSSSSTTNTTATSTSSDGEKALRSSAVLSLAAALALAMLFV
jgi:hypothetical protein